MANKECNALEECEYNDIDYDRIGTRSFRKYLPLGYI